MKRCVVIKMFGNQDMAGAIAPALIAEEDRTKEEEFKRLSAQYKMQKPKLKEYYEKKLAEAEEKYTIRKEPFYKRWFEQAMAMLVIFFHECVREVEDEQ